MLFRTEVSLPLQKSILLQHILNIFFLKEFSGTIQQSYNHNSQCEKSDLNLFGINTSCDN